MTRFAGRVVTVAALCGLFMLGSMTGIGGTQPATPGGDGSGKGAIVGTGMFTPMVENMDRSLAFYHDVFGMDVPPMPDTGMRPYNNPNPRLFAFFDILGAKERHQSARVQGIPTGVEPMEVQNVDHKTILLRVQDPGAATLVLVVRDVDAALARVKQANIPVVTPGGKPVVFADGSRAVLIRDVDSRFIEIRQPATVPPSSAPDRSNIVDIRASIAVNDMDRTKQVYRDVLGFKLEGETAFAADSATQALTGLSNAEVRRSRVQARGSALWLEFIEFKGVDRTPLLMRIQDRGAARLQLRTENIDAMVNAVKAAGLKIVTIGGGSTPIPPNFKGSLVADPNNFFVSLFEPCDGCAPRTPAAQ
jgi:catechol 2,3-dioxygenase-like lactoylglutathione lyase family enzyme